MEDAMKTSNLNLGVTIAFLLSACVLAGLPKRQSAGQKVRA
jgi:hypothetical protein